MELGAGEGVSRRGLTVKPAKMLKMCISVYHHIGPIPQVTAIDHYRNCPRIVINESLQLARGVGVAQHNA
jgi:hypothetical protein